HRDPGRARWPGEVEKGPGGPALPAQRLGVGATHGMPVTAPRCKVERTEALGAEVVLSGANVGEAKSRALQLAAERRLTFVHPYDDPDVIAGQGTVGLEVLADRPDWGRDACMVLPGTHSKWVEIVGGRMIRFSTYMTGETFAVLCKHSILGRLMPADAAPAEAESDAAFAEGVRAAQASGPGDFTHQIFAARTLGITRRMPAELLKDYLSGLLIGHELVSGLGHMRNELHEGRPLLLIGEGALCRRYVRGLELLGVEPTDRLENTAPRGLFQFAVAAGLIAPAGE
ncbi:pyridoxal-phosphate dependent enzyme, partial [Azospirillum brasilense]|nr:pyridoxal-phosphate dependent enzyme [Azospirillum brasilense]